MTERNKIFLGIGALIFMIAVIMISRFLPLKKVAVLFDCGTATHDTPGLENECFIERVASCTPATLAVRVAATGDMYRLDLLGKEGETCKVQMTITDAQSADLAGLGGTSVVCFQQDLNEFVSAKDKHDQGAARFIDDFRTGMMLHAIAGTETCTGTLKDAFVRE